LRPKSSGVGEWTRPTQDSPAPTHRRGKAAIKGGGAAVAASSDNPIHYVVDKTRLKTIYYISPNIQKKQHGIMGQSL